MARWLEIPLARHPSSKVPSWGEFAERYDRCVVRVAFYVGQRVCDAGTWERIVNETIERNVDLFIEERDELSEFRRLRASADRLIAARQGVGADRKSISSGRRRPGSG